jgi:hypothetical protein
MLGVEVENLRVRSRDYFVLAGALLQCQLISKQLPDHVVVVLSSACDPRVQAFGSSKCPLKLVKLRRFANNHEGLPAKRSRHLD